MSTHKETHFFQKGNAFLSLGQFDEAGACYESLRSVGAATLADAHLKKLHDTQEIPILGLKTSLLKEISYNLDQSIKIYKPWKVIKIQGKEEKVETSEEISTKTLTKSICKDFNVNCLLTKLYQSILW